MIDKRRLIFNAASSVVQILVSSAVLFVLYRMLLTTLGADALGIWALVLAISSTVQLANMGLTGSIVKNVAEYDARQDRRLLTRAVQTAALSIAVFSLLIVICAYPAAEFYFRFSLHESLQQDALDVLPLALIAFWIFMVGSIYQSALYGCQRIVEHSAILVGDSVLHLGLCAVLAPRYGLYGLACARVAQNVITLLVSILLLRRHVPGMPVVPRVWDRKLFREMLNYAAGFQIVSLLAMLSDPLTKGLLGRFGSVTTVGYYEMASRLVQQCRSLIVSMNQVLVPAFAGMKQTDTEKIDALFFASYRVILFLSLSGFGFLAIGAPLISHLWIGQYVPIFVFATVLLSVGWLVNTVAVPAYHACMGTGEMRLNIGSHVAMAVLNVVLGWELGRRIGAIGPMVAWTIALAAGGILLNILYFRKQALSWEQAIPASSRTLLLCCAAATLIGICFESARDSMAGTAAAAGLFAAGVALIGFGMWRDRTHRDIRRWVGQALASRS